MALPNSPPELVDCPFCGKKLTWVQRTHPKHCEDWDCTRAHAAQAAKRKVAVVREDYDRKVALARTERADALAQLSKDHGIDPTRVHIGVVPRMERDLVPLPPARKERHLTHLKAIIEEAFQNAADYAPPSGRDLGAQAGEPHPWNTAACTTCRGDCCRQGGETDAFQTAITIQHLRLTFPHMSSQDIFDHYAEALPEVSAEDACVYQGPEGCVLSREMRADICNTFRCNFLLRLAEDVDPKKSDALAIVGVEQNSVGRVGFVRLKAES